MSVILQKLPLITNKMLLLQKNKQVALPGPAQLMKSSQQSSKESTSRSSKIMPTQTTRQRFDKQWTIACLTLVKWWISACSKKSTRRTSSSCVLMYCMRDIEMLEGCAAMAAASIAPSFSNSSSTASRIQKTELSLKKLKQSQKRAKKT